MEFWMNIGPFLLAVIAVIVNGVPQLLYAQARGFALKPAGFAYLVGAVGNLLTGSVTPISSQAETITVASVDKDLRNNVSSILLATVLMVILGLCGGITRIADFAGTAVVSGMMSGVGLMLAGVSWDMFKQEKRITLVSMVSALIAYALSINDANNVVWTIFVSVAVSTADFLFLQKRRVDLTTVVEQGRKPVEMSGEWRIWKREYWRDFKPIKPVLNLTVVLGALSIMMLNIGANISFGGITASLAGTSQNFDHLSIINSLADVPSALFGGPPIEAIISGTAGAPWPVACGIVFMLLMGILILVGLVGRLGRYLPAQSISGFLLVIGFALTFAPNLATVSASDNSMSGYIALGVTAWSKNPFLGMVVGILVRYFGAYIGLA
ncbi:MAG TPA: xanthine/uracil permease [Candidatus Fimadaptatus faecigallinarum]|uniref:Xanthine/uracil permease n=1 Tax=Candidatus Fimadaptatus faecigallinarum TaxID=2840814 RepID=A0A9D1S4B0_9FIRM|nr:xanthine/uracil permease [Candidatus Fimadaptatus faecigallinarum]